MRRTWWTIAALAGVLAALLGGRTARADKSRSPSLPGLGVFERTMVEVEPGPETPVLEIDVENHLGDVRVEGHDGPAVVIFAFKRGPSDEVLDRLKVQLVRDASGVVRIKTTLQAGDDLRPLAAGSARIDLLIRAPRAVRASAAIWDGHVEVVAMEGGGSARANRGAIDVRKTRGAWVTEGTRAGQRFEEVEGSIDATTLIGDVELDRIAGDRTFASVHRGRITARHVATREVDLRVTEGDIFLEGTGVATGRYRVSTYRGNVELRLENGTRAELVAVARSGTVTFPAGMAIRETEDSARHGRIGHGQPNQVFELRAQHGNVQIGLLAAQR